MKLIKKLSTILVIFIFCFNLTACSDKSWAVQSDSEKISTGIYVFHLMQAYQEALQTLTQQGKSTSDIANETIDNQGVPNWITEKALSRCKEWLAVEKMFKELNLSFSEEETNKANESTDSAWETNGSMYEKNFGISRNDYHQAITLFNLKLEKIFESIYGKEGSEPVSDEDLIKFYKDNYVSLYFYSKVPFEEAQTSDGDENNPESDSENANKNESDTENKKVDTDESIQKEFSSYVDSINSGSQTIEQIRETIKKNEEITDETDPLILQVINQNSSSLSPEVIEAVKKLDAGKATYVKFNDVYLLLIKSSKPVEVPDFNKKSEPENKESTEKNESDTENKDSTEKNNENDGNDERKNVLYDMKYKEFEQKIKDKTNSLNYNINYNAVNQYNPLMFNKLISA